MGKKKGKRVDLDKKLALAAKKEAKAEKAARKRLEKEARLASGGAVDADDSDNDHSGDDGDDDLDVERLLQKYKQQNEVSSSSNNPTTGTGGGRLVPLEEQQQDGSLTFPLARANASLTLAADTKKHAAAYLLGGEYFDGVSNVVSDQLFKYEIATGQWKQFICGNAKIPPPRCAHSTVYYHKCLYVFGGELGSTSEYHHYKDLWKFDTVKLEWTEIKPNRNAAVPSPRSGHAVTVWKNFMILFGGFYEAAKGDQAPRWYNDLYVFNLQTEQWLDNIPHSKLSLRPEPRSACNSGLVGPNQDDWLIHGGFTKLLNNRKTQQPQLLPELTSESPILPASETKTHTDAWILHLKPLLAGQPPTWERWTSSLSPQQQLEQQQSLLTTASSSANGRSGVGSVAYQGNLLLFGGVVDQERHHHQLRSVFYNDLSLFHVSKRKFVPIRIHSASASEQQQQQTVEEKDDEDDNEDDAGANELDLEEPADNDENAPKAGWDLEQLRKNMFAFRDGHGNTVYEKIDTPNAAMNGESPADEEEKEESKETYDEEEKEESKDNKDRNRPRRRPGAAETEAIVQRTEPLPRIKSGLFVFGHRLYILGGLLEVGDREVTLDDMWSIDLRKTRCWECLYPGTMHQQVWRGAEEHDDDDSYYSNATSTGRQLQDDDDDDDSEVSNNDVDDDELTDTEADEAKVEKIEQKKSSNPKKETAELVDRYELENANTTPEPEESLSDFYARTGDYWNDKVAKQAEGDDSKTLSAKEVKRESFGLARARFEELEPVIARLLELKRQRQQEKADKKERKSKKSSKK